jgi:hypothetical protein
MILSTILAALVPVAVEGVKQASARWMGGVRATSVAEQIELDKNEIERLKALAELDKPEGTPSQWVIDLRASARYVGALAVITVGIGSLFVPGVTPAIQAITLEAANIAFGFLFGSRIVSGFKPLMNK